MKPLSCTKQQADEALYARMELMGMQRWETLVAAQQKDFYVVRDEGGAVWYYNDEPVLVWDEEDQEFMSVGDMAGHLQHFK